MTGQMRIFIILLIINFILTVLYLIFNLFRRKNNRTSFWMRGLVMLLCPVTGILFFFLGFLFYLLFFHRKVDLEDVVFSKERVQTFVRADEERGRNMVPLEEALAVTEKEELRNLMLNVLRGDISESLSSLALALNSEDSETSHYAASMLSDVLNQYRINVQKIYHNIQEEKEDEKKDREGHRFAYARMLIDYMDKILKQQVLTKMEQRDQVTILDQVCEMVWEEMVNQEDRSPRMILTAADFETVSMRLLEVEDYERCQLWCERGTAWYPNTLSSYACRLKLYFTTGQRESFFSTLKQLRESEIPVDHETLEMIRAFM